MAVFQTRIKNYSKFLPSEVESISKAIFENLSADEQKLAMHMLDEILAGNSDSLFEYESIDYERPVIGVREWIDDPYYMGEIGKSLYGVWKEDLIELFESRVYNTAILTGGLGSGKSTFSQVAIMRMLYEASCLKNPVQTYGLSDGSKIGFCFLAPTADVARRVVFEGLIEKFKRIPYFTEDFAPFNKLKKEVIRTNEIPFPKSITLFSGSSSDNSIIGQNIVGGFVDELNFFQKMSQTKQRSGKINERFGLDDKAGRLFDSIMRRMKSRFANMGKLPGILIGASSKTSEDSLTERVIRQAVESKDPTIFVRDRSILDVKPQQFSKHKFKVFIGDENRRPRILKSEDVNDYPSDAVIEIPEDLRREFETNLEESLRDLAGISTNAISVFISDSDKITACIDPTRKHPFRCVTMGDMGQWDSRSPYTIDWSSTAKQKSDGSWEPILSPDRPRVVHLDPGLTGDAYAIAIGHIAGTRRIEKLAENTEGISDPIIEDEPLFVLDFILRVEGNAGAEVLFKNIRKIIYDFSEHGFSISKITMDTFQSRETMQILRDQGYNVETLSLDRTKDPYKYLRRVIYDERLKYYKYQPLTDELMRLEDNTDKIDHPAGFRKDCADALCGAVWTLFETGNYGLPAIIQKGDSKSIEDPGFVIDAQQEIQMSGQTLVKKPKTLNPVYRRNNEDGSSVDLSKGHGPIIEIF